jgi:hypothetical protein
MRSGSPPTKRTKKITMRLIQANELCRGLAKVAVVLALSMCPSHCDAWSGLYGCYGPPHVISPLDMPLTPYTMPRRPARGGSEFRYTVKPSPQCQLCGCALSNEDTTAGCLMPYRPEMSEVAEPGSFERLGHIPHESLLGSGPIAAGPASR